MRSFFALAAAVAVATAILAGGFGPGVVAGQEAGNAPTETPTNESDGPVPDVDVNVTLPEYPGGDDGDDATPTPEPTPADVEPEPNATGTPVDEDVSLIDWSFSDGVFTLVFEHSGERPKSATLSESTQPEEGVQQFTVRQERLLPGRTTVTVPMRIRASEVAVSVTTADCLDAESCIVVSTGRSANPFAAFGGTTGVLSGVGLSILTSGAGAAWVIWREQSGVVKA